MLSFIYAPYLWSLTHSFPGTPSPSMATLNLSFFSKTLTPSSLQKHLFTPSSSPLHLSFSPYQPQPFSLTQFRTQIRAAAAVDGEYSAKRSSSNEQRETIMLPGCDYNHWLIVMEFPKDPAPTREQMIDTYLNTLATVLGR